MPVPRDRALVLSRRCISRIRSMYCGEGQELGRSIDLESGRNLLLPIAQRTDMR